MRNVQTAMDGYLKLIKPPGMTSHDLVNVIRRLSGQRKVGHAGTLDPAAAGLMLLALGRATRLLEYAVGGKKTYRAEMIFGLVSDTQDSSGRILQSLPAAHLSREDVRRAIEPFLGHQTQLPPMVSAVRVGGRRLHELARRGLQVERPRRQIEVTGLEMLDFRPGEQPRALLHIVCSAGTYVRTICHDIGQLLGCGAVMSFLVRTGSGEADIAEALTIRGLNGDVRGHLLAADGLVASLPCLIIDQPCSCLFMSGAAVPAEACGDLVYRVYGPDKRFLGLGQASRQAAGTMLQPRKVLADGDI